MSISVEQGSSKSKRRPKRKVVRSKTKRPRSRSRAHVDEIAALGSVSLSDNGQYEPSYTIPEFCAAERISTTFYYEELRKKGVAPRETHYGGNVIRVTHRSRIEWQDKMANLPPEKREALDAVRARRRLQAQAAATKSVQSPNHISKRRKRAAQTTPPFRFEEHKRMRRGQQEAT